MVILESVLFIFCFLVVKAVLEYRCVVRLVFRVVMRLSDWTGTLCTVILVYFPPNVGSRVLKYDFPSWLLGGIAIGDTVVRPFDFVVICCFVVYF